MNRRRRLLLALLAVFALVVASCGEDDDEDVAAEEEELPTEEEAPDEGEGDAAPAEEGAADGAAQLEVSGVAFDSSTVTIINTGDAPVDLTGHWICNRPTYSELPPVELGPGEGVEVDFESVDPAGGEVALYRSNDFGSSEDILSYVTWGSGGGRTAVAEEAGVWSGPAVEITAEGTFLVGDPGSAGGWS